MSPNPVTGSNSSQPFTINGSGFVSASTVTLRDKRTREVFPNRPISSLSSTSITINPVFTTIAATWSVEVINNGVSSGEYTFQVEAPLTSNIFDYPVGYPDGIGWNHGQNCINAYPYDTCIDGYDFLEWALYSSGGVWHPGEDWNIDIGEDFQKSVYAIGKGIVRASIDRDEGGFGKVVLIEHEAQPGSNYILTDENGSTGSTVSKVYSLYAHLDSIEPEIIYEYEIKEIGKEIGKVGTTGSVPSHLHFEIRHKTFNPITCVDEDSSSWNQSTWEAFAQKAWCEKANSISSVKNYFVDPSNFINFNRSGVSTRVGYPGAIWKGPAAEGNFEELRGSYTNPSMVILHTIVLSGTGWSAGAALSRFKTLGQGASAHYIVKQNGDIWQVVSDKDTAYHAGNLDYNQRSIGIEMEGWADGNPDSSWQTSALYTSLQNLISWLSTQYNIPLDRNNIIGHNQVPSPGSDKNGRYVPCADQGVWGGCCGDKPDPGPYWNWVKLMEGLGQTVNDTILTVQNSCSVLTLPQSGAPSFISVWPGQQFVAHDFYNGYYLLSTSGQEAAQPGYISSGEYHWDGWIPSSCVSVDSGLIQLEVTGVFPG